jgi:hypothetical protein
MRPILGCDVNAVVTLLELDPMGAPLPLAVYTSLGMYRETRCPIYHTVPRAVRLDDL